MLDASTGQVLTRIGGKQSTVKMGPGTRTAWQHDARMLPNGDDPTGVPRTRSRTQVQPQSRGIVERRNRYQHHDARYPIHPFPARVRPGTQGNVQTLPNGNV